MKKAFILASMLCFAVAHNAKADLFTAPASNTQSSVPQNPIQNPQLPSQVPSNPNRTEFDDLNNSKPINQTTTVTTTDSNGQSNSVTYQGSPNQVTTGGNDNGMNANNSGNNNSSNSGLTNNNSINNASNNSSNDNGINQNLDGNQTINKATPKVQDIGQLAKELVGAMTLAEGFKYQSWADAGCVDWQIVGICIKWKHGHPVIAPKVSMWLPVLILETPNKFAYSKIDIVNMMLKAVGAIADTAGNTLGSPAEITSGSITADKDHPLQFREVHIVGFPLKAFEIMHPKPKYCDAPITDMFPYYFSEIDLLNWRQAADQATFRRYLSGFLQAIQACSLANIPSNLINGFGGNAGSVSLGNMCIGNWATLYPRVGFVNQSSEVVGSAVDAVRGASWDSQSNNQPRFMISAVPLDISTGSDKIQMAIPHKESCMNIGTNFASWDKNLVAKDGDYVWIYWKKFTCCMW